MPPIIKLAADRSSAVKLDNTNFFITIRLNHQITNSQELIGVFPKWALPWSLDPMGP